MWTKTDRLAFTPSRLISRSVLEHTSDYIEVEASVLGIFEPLRRLIINDTRCISQSMNLSLLARVK